MIAGDITLAVADVDLVHVSLRALISSVASLEEGPGERAVIELSRSRDAAAPPPPARLRALAAGGDLVAIVGPAEGDDDDVSAEALWRHEELVEELMADRDVLPVRYGTRFADEEEAVRAVAARRATFAAALDHVRGALEFAVRGPVVRARRAVQHCARQRREGGARRLPGRP